MTEDLAGKAAEMMAKMAGSNPSNEPGKSPAERRRVPMTEGTLKLQVPDLPGYHLQWLRGADRVRQAVAAGFEFINDEDVSLNDAALGGNGLKSGNTDLGTRVSIVDGSEKEPDGQPMRLILMKQRQEFYDEDQAIHQRRNDAVVDSLTTQFRQGTVGVGAAGNPGENSSDVGQRYVDPKRTQIPDLFRRKS